MSRTGAAVGSFLFLILAPGTLAGLVPWWLTGWRIPPGPPWREAFEALGAGVLLLGLLMLVECFGRFALVGRGTPAPLAPTQHLVLTGAYRRVRNPMYVAVVAMILGQAALFGDLRLLGYAVLVWLGFHIFVVAYEEPTLKRSFPAEYPAFFAAVPRWIPRVVPWRGT
jgi:protein-S-isoprenylcysteine O-methyltransferase Ste14